MIWYILIGILLAPMALALAIVSLLICWMGIGMIVGVYAAIGIWIYRRISGFNANYVECYMDFMDIWPGF